MSKWSKCVKIGLHFSFFFSFFLFQATKSETHCWGTRAKKHPPALVLTLSVFVHDPWLVWTPLFLGFSKTPPHSFVWCFCLSICQQSTTTTSTYLILEIAFKPAIKPSLLCQSLNLALLFFLPSLFSPQLKIRLTDKPKFERSSDGWPERWSSTPANIPVLNHVFTWY